jgi:hypothetical protein
MLGIQHIGRLPSVGPPIAPRSGAGINFQLLMFASYQREGTDWLHAKNCNPADSHSTISPQNLTLQWASNWPTRKPTNFLRVPWTAFKPIFGGL